MILLFYVMIWIKDVRADNQSLSFYYNETKTWHLLIEQVDHEAILLTPIFAATNWIILRFKLKNSKTINLTILRDTLSANDFRKLKILLKSM